MTKATVSIIFILAVIVVSVTIHIGHQIINQYNTTNNRPEENNSSNNIHLVEDFLREARNVYLNKTCPKDVFTCGNSNVDSLTLKIIFNATIENDTIVVDGVKYRYMIVGFYDKEKNISIFPEKITAPDSISIEYIPRNKSVTYTGGQPYTFLVRVNGETCKFTFWYIGFQISSFSMLGRSHSCNSIRAVEIYLGKNHYLWLILVKET